MYSQSTLGFCSHTKTDLPVPRADLTDLDLTDAHVHVFDPKRFPYAAERSYTPGEATVAQLRERHRQLRLQRAVLVQPSVYGTDNACLLDAVSALGLDRARGIAVADLRQVTRHALMDWNARGIRGLRLNLEVQHEADPPGACPSAGSRGSGRHRGLVRPVALRQLSAARGRRGIAGVSRAARVGSLRWTAIDRRCCRLAGSPHAASPAGERPRVRQNFRVLSGVVAGAASRRPRPPGPNASRGPAEPTAVGLRLAAHGGRQRAP
jgi:Amidohydrolase